MYSGEAVFSSCSAEMEGGRDAHGGPRGSASHHHHVV
jgi:hypothetical protein